jgi:hypothetical protein
VVTDHESASSWSSAIRSARVALGAELLEEGSPARLDGPAALELGLELRLDPGPIAKTCQVHLERGNSLARTGQGDERVMCRPDLALDRASATRLGDRGAQSRAIG